MEEIPKPTSTNSKHKLKHKLIPIIFGLVLLSIFSLIVINMSTKSVPTPEKKSASVSASKTYQDGLVVTVEVRSIDGSFKVKIIADNNGSETLTFQGPNGCSRFNVDILNSLRSDQSKSCTQALIDDELVPGEELASDEFNILLSEVEGNCIEAIGLFYEFASDVARACTNPNTKSKSQTSECGSNSDFVKECTQLLVRIGYDEDEEATLELAQYALKKFDLAVITQEKYNYDYTIDSFDRETCEATKEPVYDLWLGKFYVNIPKDQAKSIRAEITKQITLDEERRFQAELEDATDETIAKYKDNRLFIRDVQIEPLYPEIFEYDSTDC